MRVKDKVFRIIFWLGYVAVFATSFIHFKKDLHNITVDVVSLELHLDQLLHILVYFLICNYFLAGRFFGLILFRENSFRKFLIAIFILATITEFVQLGIPYRSFKVFDMVANFAGILSGIFVIWLMRGKTKIFEKVTGDE